MTEFNIARIIAKEKAIKNFELATKVFLPNPIDMAITPPATPPASHSLGTFTGSVQENVQTEMVTTAAPIDKNLANDFSVLEFHMTQS
jgi:hypothetical protein